uniref:Translation initiation factor IF-3, chloroplastic n=1 Tax=Bostrychia moritziana TaxID=103713 RepID=A0A1Z1M6K5_BOSMO|nr:translation initiation factor 3 [Bostrychia moritziana]ARW61629.1 translation initiation factor 3 [Bostrychia moritziana]
MKKKYNEQEHIINDQIKYPTIRLIDVLGEQLGIFSSNEALDIALNKGLDLVVISDKSEPPVCKIVDYGKYKFAQEKKAKEAKKKQHSASIKEVKMRYKIEEHDYKVRLNQALRFLQAGDKVKTTIVFRGREIQHFNLAIQLLTKMAKDLKHLSEIQQAPMKDGKNVTMILSPQKKS